jgi:hypothetical protein
MQTIFESYLVISNCFSHDTVPEHLYRHLIQSQSYVTIDGQSPSLSWNKAPIWGLRPDLYYCQTVAGLLMWGALSDERMGLSFARVTVSSNKSVVSVYNLYFTYY